MLAGELELNASRPAEDSLIAPAGVISPIAGTLPASVNHTLPSGPAAIESGMLAAFSPVVNSVTVPLGVIFPIALTPVAALKMPGSVNHRFRSGPSTMSSGMLALPVCSPAGDSVIVPLGVIFPIEGVGP
jgi:hypothetical protein